MMEGRSWGLSTRSDGEIRFTYFRVIHNFWVDW